MIAILMGFGLGKRVAQAVAYIGLPLLLLGAAWFALDWYGDSRFDDGVVETDAKWEEAGNRLVDQAAVARNAADAKAEERAADFAAATAIEKEKLDAAEREGSSPLDVLFDGGVR